MDCPARGYTGISYRLLYLDMVWELTLDRRESSDSSQERHYCYMGTYCERLMEGAVILSHLNWTGNWREKGYCDIGHESYQKAIKPARLVGNGIDTNRIIQKKYSLSYTKGNAFLIKQEEIQAFEYWVVLQ
jgi:hypothetical protein